MPRRRSGAATATCEKLRQRDKSLWTGTDEDRWLGWLDAVGADRIKGYQAFAAEVKAQGFRDVLLLGMGGSSLDQEVLAKTLGSAPRPIRSLHVLNSTDPGAGEDFRATHRSGAHAVHCFQQIRHHARTERVDGLLSFKQAADVSRRQAKAGRHFRRHHRSGLGA